MAGRLIVLEGTDGSGKSTQFRRLSQRLSAEGQDFHQLVFPRYQEESSALIRLYLSGAFGSRPGDVNAYAASSFYAVDRYASYKRDWGAIYENGGTIVADRYATSNAVHQCSKLPRDEWDEYLDWLFRYEYDLLGIPAPDLVIYLRVDPDVSQRLMRARYHGDEAKRDIHERDLDYQRRSREAAEYCAKRFGWRDVACARDGEMRSIDDIHAEVMDIVKSL